MYMYIVHPYTCTYVHVHVTMYMIQGTCYDVHVDVHVHLYRYPSFRLSLTPSSLFPSLPLSFSHSLSLSLPPSLFLPVSPLLSLSPIISLHPLLIQVLQLLTEHDGRDDQEVIGIKERVDALLDCYHLVETSGHRELNEIRDIASRLELQWTQFYSDIEQRHRNLHLSLHFQEYLFEVRIYLYLNHTLYSNV